MMRPFLACFGLAWCTCATIAQNTVVYLIPDDSGSDEARIAFDNSLDYAFELVNNSDHALLFAEGYAKQFVAFNPADAQSILDSLRKSDDGIRLSERLNSVRAFQAALDQFEMQTGLSLLDEEEPNFEFHVLVAGELHKVVSDNLLMHEWFEPVFRQNGWPSPLRQGKTWPLWFQLRHRFDLDHSGISTQMP
jgi:hypothetical protein